MTAAWRRRGHPITKAPFRGRVNQPEWRDCQREASRSDGFLELLGSAEGDLLGGLDVDRFAGRGVAAHARRTLAYLQDAEPDDADTLALLQVLGDPADHVVENGLGLL